MVRSISALLACSSVFAATASAWEHTSGQDFAAAVEPHKAAVVAFVNHGEAKSKNLEIEWPAVLADAKVPVISVDCSTDTAICLQQGITSDATIKLLQKGITKAIYDGPRRASAILAWIDRVQRSGVVRLTNDDMPPYKEADEAVCIAFTKGSEFDFRDNFDKVARRLGDRVSFGITFGPASAAQEKVLPPSIKCFRTRDGADDADTAGKEPGTSPITPEPREHTGLMSSREALAATADEIEAFVKDSTRPVIGELLQSNHQEYLDLGNPMVYIFAATEEDRASFRAALQFTAKAYSKALTMVTVDPLELPDLAASLGLEPGLYPSGAIHMLTTGEIYHYPRDRDIRPNDLTSWGLKVKLNLVKPNHRVAPVFTQKQIDELLEQRLKGGEAPEHVRDEL